MAGSGEVASRAGSGTDTPGAPFTAAAPGPGPRARGRPEPSSIRARIAAKQYGQALADLEIILRDEPDDAGALYMSAVCRRYRREFDTALALLARLKTLAHEVGRVHQEEGHVYRDSARPGEALRAYERACRFNPALVASWRGQVHILSRKGRIRQAAQAKAQLDYLHRLPKPLVAVIDLVSQGKLLKAEDLCRKFLRKVPHHVEAMRLLADIGIRLGVLADAEFLLESAHRFEPKNVRVHIDYIQALRKRQKFRRAVEEAKRLLATSPENPQFQSIYAVECMQTGDYEKALAMFGRVLKRLPGDPNTLTSRGHAFKTLGQYREAVASYQAALKSQPRHGEAWYSLSNLKVYSFGDGEIERMSAQARGRNLAQADRIHLCFALGKAHEDRDDYETSFRHYEQGNRLKKAEGNYDAAQMTEDLRAQRRVCTADVLARGGGAGFPAGDPIFVVGLPRAGSTLLEQILSSHSGVDGTLELPNVLSLSQQLRRRGRKQGEPGFPEILATLSGEELEAFGRQYIEDTRIHRQGAPFFIDKMPNNFRHIGLIHLMLPNAKIIDARRHPMACGFSGFKQLFAEGQQFTYDLDALGRYYRDYVELMDHWDAVLPGKVLRVRYEDVVGDLETQVRRILDHCGLEFEPGCLSFYRTERAVRTPSSEQVRQPIFKSGLDYWRNYEPWLEPLKAALGDGVRRRFGI